MIAFVVSMLAGVWAVGLKLFRGTSFILTPLPVIAIVLLAISVQFFLMGLLAELLVRTYHESQDKAIYAVRERVGFDNGLTSA
jgi:dolichol-phosphate mannosyltransferase